MRLQVILILTMLSSVSQAEIYLTEEKCKIKDPDFSLTTNLKSTVEDGISSHRFTSVLKKTEDNKMLWLRPESPMDATTINIGTKYTLVGQKTKLTLAIKKAKEKSSFSASEESACTPVLSVKEYDVEVQGLGRPQVVKMVCDNRSVFVSSKCNKTDKTKTN